MKTYQLKRIDPASAARILAAIYGGMLLIISLLFVPLFALAPIPTNANAPPKALLVLFPILYPLMGALMGWMTGAVGSRIYNFAASRIGGFRFEAVEVEEADG